MIQAQAGDNGAPPPLAARPPELSNQHALYDRMVQGAPGITKSQLSQYFKDASFGVKTADVARTYSPRAGLTIVGDRPYNVPHVYGATRADVLHGAGYVSAEDRLF